MLKKKIVHVKGNEMLQHYKHILQSIAWKKNVPVHCSAWAEQRQMEFNPDKCEMMYFGRSNKDRMHAKNEGTQENIKDLNVWV